MTFWKWTACVGVVVLTACGGGETLDVRPFHLRTVRSEGSDEPLLMAEEKRRLHGAIGVREQEQRLGHYYTVLWENDAVGQPVKIRFEYQQGGSGSQVKWQEQEFDASSSEGKAEFRVIGDDYLKGGRVLAWKCTLFRGGEAVESRQSYLWE